MTGPQADSDHTDYLAWQKTDEVGGPAGKYLVNPAGQAVWLVDPGINGTHDTRPDGSHVEKFSAPKAVLVSYIIKGILDHKLPWALVLLGVMIAVVLEMSGIPSLAFAVGVYLPISSSTPIFIGGVVRALVDSRQRRHWRSRQISMSEEEMVAEGDKSPGVLLSSGVHRGWGDCRDHRGHRAGGRSTSSTGAWRSGRPRTIRCTRGLGAICCRWCRSWGCACCYSWWRGSGCFRAGRFEERAGRR